MKLSMQKILAKMTGYDAANPQSGDRALVQREKKSEDGILTQQKRARLIALQRDAFRNTTFPVATSLQLQVNVVGTTGGKLTFTTDDQSFNETAGKAFRRWARHCDFTDGTSLNEMLQILLIQLTHNGGDFIAVFDDGKLTGGNGSGKIRIFETDEIKNIHDYRFRELYGEGYNQQNGIVTDPYGRICGAFVSSHGRGKDEFDDDEFIHLTLDTPADFTESNWILVAKRWRKNQLRGVSTSSHVTNLLQDLAETQAAEVQAAKLNAGMGIVISDSDASTDAENGGSPFSQTPGYDDLSDEDRDELDRLENQALKQASTTIASGKSAIIKLSGDKKLDSFKTERPNLNTVEFIRDQRNEAGTVYGLPSCYVQLKPEGSYTAFRGALVMAERNFSVIRKKLEREFLDWVAIAFVRWAGFGAPEDLDECLVWRWPTMPEVDEGSWQTAIEKMFTNGTITSQDLNGANWRKVADQQAIEKKYFEERGLVYPAARTVSGGIVDTKSENDEKEVSK